MLIPSKPYYITPEEYLANEHHSEIKHEYIDGSIYPIVNKIGNITLLLPT